MKNLVLILILAALSASAQNALDTVTLAWNPSPSPAIAKYKLYFSQSTNAWTHVKDAGLSLQTTVGLPAFGKWYFIATAVATNVIADGLESLPSNMIEIDVVPGPDAPSALRILSVVSTRIETVVKAPNITTVP